jgi:cytoskeleton protein RodZ
MPNAGALLAAERERQSLSRSDIAHRLHMSASQVEALETGDYTRLPRGTFLRGFVRNYAKAVGLDPEPVLAALIAESPEDSRPGIVVASQNIRFDPIGDRLSNPYVKAAGLATVVVAGCFAVMYWWLFIRTALPVPVSRKPVVAEAPKVVEPKVVEPKVVEPLPTFIEAPRVEAPAPAPVAPAKIDPPPASTPAPVKTAPAKSEAPKAEATKAAPPKTETAFASPASSSGGTVIRLKFKGTAWVEIKDGQGKVLLSRNQPGGSEAEVIGKPPFVVVVGNAPEVQMFLNDRPFDLEPHTKVAVARFTIN